MSPAAAGAQPAGPMVLGDPGQATNSPPPVFRSSVDLVSVAAVVRDRRGRLVGDLAREDFEVFDAGVRRHIVEFAPSIDGPVSLAVLFDTSGSMRMTDNLGEGVRVVDSLLTLLRPGSDEVALFAFDSALRELSGFTPDTTVVRRLLADLDAFGTTALYDAVGTVAAHFDDRPHRRRALVVVTDGLDTSSRRSVDEVSAIASASDVPVYVVTVGLEDVAGDGVTYEPAPATPVAHLGNLAYWTGGACFNGRGLQGAGVAAQRVLAELRHQYLLAFESAGPGWRPVDVRLRRNRLTVRTRSAYQSNRPSGN